MVNRLWLVAMFLGALACAPLHAEPAPVVADPAIAHLELGMTASLMEDPSGTMTLDDVLAVGPARFVERPTRIGATGSAFWLRVTLANRQDRSVHWWFDSGNWTLQEIDFYAPDQHGRYRRQVNGALLPFGARPLPTTTFVFPLDLAPSQDTVVYLRARCTGYMGLSLRPQLWQPAAYQAEKTSEKLQWFFYLGIAAGLGLYNFLLYVTVRDANYRRYLYSVIAVSAGVSFGGGGLGLGAEFCWPDWPFLGQLSIAVIMFPTMFFPYYFALRYVDDYVTMRRWIAVALASLAIIGGISLIEIARVFFPSLFASHVAQVLMLVVFMVVAVLMLTVALGNAVFVMKGNRRSIWLLIAWTPITLVMLELVISPFTNVFPNRVHAMWASAFELVFMALALADRINIERRTREQAQLALVDVLKRSESELELKVSERTVELTRERGRAQDLLHNILPLEVAAELSATGAARPLRHESATILFTDFIGFTQTVSTMPADRMVTELNDIFAAFDDITDACGVEKIKTIGDAYMAAAGLPLPCADHAQRCVRAALAMLAFLEERNRHAAFKWALRIGIHSGPVVAGIVGKRKYAFDIWGDTVNIASRLESAGNAGRVNVSAYTYDLVHAEFDCEYRGKIAAKGKGEMDMYFVKQACATV